MHEARLALFHYFSAMTEDRRKHPRDDLVSVLTHAHIAGEPLPVFELMSYYFLLVVAGNETTRNATSGGLLALIFGRATLDAAGEALGGELGDLPLAAGQRDRGAGGDQAGNAGDGRRRQRLVVAQLQDDRGLGLLVVAREQRGLGQRDVNARAGHFGNRADGATQLAFETAAEVHLLEDVDLVLVMSVNPGFGGQSFIASQLRKVEAIRTMIDKSGRAIRLEVDGGVDAVTAPQCVAAGADVLVAGSASFKGGPDRYAANIAALKGLAQETAP